MQPVDIIIPVYRGLAQVQTCLSSVMRSKQQIDHELIIIDDCSPEPDVSRYLKALAAAHSAVTLIGNAHNLGFVASVNLAMRLHADRDVVLLNSDTQVAGNWLDRLRRCAYRSADIATATPFSNNATICSFPCTCHDNTLPTGLTIDTIDQMLASINAGMAVDIPTAVGFCMFIKRQCLEQIGLFDQNTFGRGYGEENDFCMRAAKRKWRHVLCADTFVYHAGAVSFGQERNERLTEAMARLDRRYPTYHHLVRQHIAADPARHARMLAWLHLLRDMPMQKILHLNHNMGGGTEKHIQELAAAQAGRALSLVLRSAANGYAVLSLGTEKQADRIGFFMPMAYADLLRLCRWLGGCRVHFHHTMGFETSLWGLARDLRQGLDVTCHDYYFINANPTLTDIDGRFCQDSATRDACCQKSYPIPGGVSAHKWRDNQKLLLYGADRVFAPSQSTAKIIGSYYRRLKPVVAFHPDWENDAPYAAVRMQKRVAGRSMLRVLALGALSPEKGADLLEDCAQIACRQKLPLQFHLIGYGYRPLDAAVVQHGPYHDRYLDDLIRNNQPDLIWFPALWPETYSYTLSAALRLGIALVAPNFGAFPERLEHRPLTWLEPWDQSAQDFVLRFMKIRQFLQDLPPVQQRMVWRNQPEPPSAFSYHAHYLLPAQYPPPETKEAASPAAARNQAWLPALIDRPVHGGYLTSDLSCREKLLLLLLTIRKNRWVLASMHLIPYRLQKIIKRRLSERPVHEILLHRKDRAFWQRG